jgi:hypothetical protein
VYVHEIRVCCMCAQEFESKMRKNELSAQSTSLRESFITQQNKKLLFVLRFLHPFSFLVRFRSKLFLKEIFPSVVCSSLRNSLSRTMHIASYYDVSKESSGNSSLYYIQH